VEHSSGNDVWKWIATSAIGFIVGVAVPWFVTGRDMVTKQDMQLIIAGEQRQLDDLTKQSGQMQEEIKSLEVQVAKVGEQVKTKRGEKE
jgi:peptidoglycan hydrolase CwlO-like protein